MKANSAPLQLQWGARTDVGRTRAVNQDALLASPPLFIVADGMGGHAAGDVASRLAIETFSTLAGQSTVAVRELVVAARLANDRILQDVAEHPERTGMGTTITGFSVGVGPLGAYAAVFNVGDSRTYLLRDNQMRMLTLDHSVVQEMLEAGDIEEHEVAAHPYRHVVTRVLGGSDELEVDTGAVPLRSGDRLLVCSDGLSSVVAADEIEAALAHRDIPERIANLLIQLALDAGAPDNVSAIVVEVIDAPVPVVEDEDGADTIPGSRMPSLR